jgi:transposase
MLDQALRQVILRLYEKGHSVRKIAQTLDVSRTAVRKVIESGSAEPPYIERAHKAEPFLDEIRNLYVECRGNLVRVHEKLLDLGAELSYPALSRFCRHHGIGKKPKGPVGHYHFEPGQEMQHDTSPHRAHIGEKLTLVQTASLVLCYSRMILFQHYPTFNRFYAKLFLTEAFQYLKGVCQTCMIDNTHVVVLRGTGVEMIPVPEMEAFAQRFGFQFRAHEKGDANRSARVERPMHYIENNFLAGRRFDDFSDINQQARQFCDTSNAKTKRHLGASPRELFAREQPQLRPLPLYVPEVYQLHHRIVDTEGYVCVHNHRYSVPYTLIGRRLEVRETYERMDLFEGPRLVASHRKAQGSLPKRITRKEHRPPRGKGPYTNKPSPEEEQLLAWGEPLKSYVRALKKRSRGRATVAFRRLVRLCRDYPRDPLLQAVQSAAHYGMYDLERLEKMILRIITTDFFILSRGENDHE